MTYYQTGTPISRIGFSDAYTRPEFFLDTRGTNGRVQSSYDADLHLGGTASVDVNGLLGGGCVRHRAS